jgi:acyl-CoA thioesterase I
MRKQTFLFILTATFFLCCGCRVDSTPQRSSNVDTQLANRSRPVEPEPTSDPPPVSARPASTSDTFNDTRPIIVCFGDSLTAGYGTDAGQSYPDYLQSLLDSRGYHYQVANLGVSGNTTKDGVERLPHVLSLHPYIVVVEFGGNDGLRGVPISDSRANLDHIISAIKATGARVVIAGITLPPSYGPDYIKQFNDTYIVLANKYKAPMLPFLLQNVYGVPGLMQRDDTHATAAGNKIVAANLFPILTPMLKK